MKFEIFETKEQYLEMIQAWKESCKDGTIFLKEHYALYAILRDKDPAKCFASPDKQSKKKLICQGKNGNEAYKHAMQVINGVYYSDHLLLPFKGKLSKEQIEKMRSILKGEQK